MVSGEMSLGRFMEVRVLLVDVSVTIGIIDRNYRLLSCKDYNLETVRKYHNYIGNE